MDKAPRNVTLKISLDEDIRRVSVEQNFTFETLIKTLRRLFKYLTDADVQGLNIRYLDEENDWITLSSDEELKEAKSLSPFFLRLALSRAKRTQKVRKVNRWRGSRNFFQLQKQALKLLASNVPENIIAARSLFEEQVKISDHATPLYHIACCEALLAHSEEALGWLQKAVNAGFRKVRRLENEEDLKSLRNLDGFKAIITFLKNLKSSETSSIPLVLVKPVETEAAKFAEVKSELAQEPGDLPTSIENCTPKPAEEKCQLFVATESSPPTAEERSQTSESKINSGGANQETLLSMGFTDQKKNQEALSTAKGDIVTAVQILLGEHVFFRWSYLQRSGTEFMCK